MKVQFQMSYSFQDLLKNYENDQQRGEALIDSRCPIMCEHYSVHKAKQFYAAIQNPRVRLIAISWMQPLAVIKDPDIFKYSRLGILPGNINLMVG